MESTGPFSDRIPPRRNADLHCFRQLSSMVKTDLDAWLESPGRSPTAQSRVALARTLRRFLTESPLTLANSSTELEQPEERATAEFRYKSAVQYLALLDYLRSKSGQDSRRYRSRLAEVERRQAGFLNLDRLTAGGKGMYAESLLFNCGMSAYDALCDQLSLVPNLRERDHLRPVVFCTSAYNENEWVVRDAFGENRIRLIRPDHTQAILRGIYHHQALAVFCEILSNNVDLLRFPLKEILDRLRGRAPPRVVYLVVDVTSSGSNLALDRLLTLPPARNVVLVLTESLQKFYQRGLEVTSGGMIHLVSSSRAAIRRLAEGLRRFRELNQTALEPYSLYKYRLLAVTLEDLNLKAQAHWRNTRTLGKYLRELSHPFLATVSVPSGADGALPPACAPYLWLILRNNDFHHARLLVFCMIQAAKQWRVNVQYRDSFYFNCTTLHMSRDYYQGLRVSSGVEDLTEVERLKLACRQALDSAWQFSRAMGIRELELRTDPQLAAMVEDRCRSCQGPG